MAKIPTSSGRQVELEELIGKTPKKPQGEISDAFTGELFQPHTRNHYEVPDPKPFAPNLAIARPTVRQRVENLLQRGIDPLHDFMRQQRETDDLDFEVPDDPDAPLTHAEQMHLDQVASSLAEQAPLPDDGLPRAATSSPEGQPKAADTPGGGGSAATSAPPKGAAGGDSPPAPGPVKT